MPLLLGLHRLVEIRDGKRVPELFALSAPAAVASGAERFEWSAKAPVDAGGRRSAAPACNDNVILFRPYLLARKRRRD